MTSRPLIEHRYSTCASEGYTSFVWVLKDWMPLRDHYKKVTSPDFVLNNTGGKRCKVKFRSENGFQTTASIKFPEVIEYTKMKASLSFLDENSLKLITREKIFRNSKQICEVSFDFDMNDTNARKYLRNDSITLFLELTIVKVLSEFTHSGADFNPNICQNCKVILNRKDLYDVTFVVDGKRLYAHKGVLAANSAVFRAMFAEQMEEQKNITVEIADADATVFEAFLCYVYTGELSEIENIVDELIVLADECQVMNLKKACERYMSNHINDDNVITNLLTAYRLSCNELKTNCIDFVRNNIHVLGKPDILVKLAEYPNIVSQLFRK